MKKTTASAISTVGLQDSVALAADIAAGADVNVSDRDGRTPLHAAALEGIEDATAMLLAAGADPNSRDDGGRTALHFAAAEYHLGVAEQLLNAGAIVDASDEHGNTPLFRATFESRGRGGMISLLLRHGADRDHVNRRGVSPRELAFTISNFDVKQWFGE